MLSVAFNVRAISWLSFLMKVFICCILVIGMNGFMTLGCV